MGDAKSGPVRLSFNPQLRVESRGATVTSDGGLLLPRELNERLGQGALIEPHLTDPRTGRNRQCPLPDLVRQSIYTRLAGTEDTNDAERLAQDPAFRMLASRERRETTIALTPTPPWFETQVLTDTRSYHGLSRRNTELVQREATGPPTRRVTLDIDSSARPVHGTQEQSAYNGRFESVCCPPLFVFTQDGDCLDARLRPGNVHSADGWGGAYAIRLPANDVLERAIEDRLVRPRGRPSRAPGSGSSDPVRPETPGPWGCAFRAWRDLRCDRGGVPPAFTAS